MCSSDLLGELGEGPAAMAAEVYQIESDFKAKVEGEFNKMIAAAAAQPATEQQ